MYLDFEDYVGIFVILAVLLVMVFACVVTPWLNYASPEIIQGEVTDSYIKIYGSSDYFHHVVLLPDGTEEIFQNRDAFFLGKWDSADIELKVDVGSEYVFEVRGTRWAFYVHV